MMHSQEQTANDAQLAYELQQAELGQAGGPGAAPVVQARVVGTTGCAAPGQVGPVVVTTEINSGLPPAGPRAVIVGVALPKNELIVLSYRRTVMCLAFIDVISTVVNSAILVFNEEYEEHRAAWYLGLLGLIFLIGPICGIVGANRLNRGAVFVYVIFTIAKTTFDILGAILTPYLWNMFFALIQIWITKIVITFWMALGQIPMAERPRLLNADQVEARMVLW